MNEKLSINDVLASLNSIISMCQFTIEHSNNKNFRETIRNARNNFEDLQWEVYLIAKEKGYYIPAATAGDADLEQVKKAISG